MFSPEMAVKMLKERRNGRKRLGQRNFRPLYMRIVGCMLLSFQNQEKVPRNRIFRNK